MLIAAALLLLLIAFALPLAIRSRDLPPPEVHSPTQHLEDRKAAIYENLRDLQGEYRMNKLSDEDYQASKQELQRELAEILARIDAATRTDVKGGKTASEASA